MMRMTTRLNNGEGRTSGEVIDKRTRLIRRVVGTARWNGAGGIPQHQLSELRPWNWKALR